MLQPNADNNNDNTKVTALTDIENESDTLKVSGVIFNQLPSPSNLSYHSNYQSQEKKYKSITASNHAECDQFKPFTRSMPSKAATNNDPFIPPSKASNTSSSSSSASYDVIFVPPQKVKAFSGSIPMGFNRISSFSVNVRCSDVLLKICQILSNYTADIEYKVRSNEYRIDGVVFMRDHNSVFFMVSIFKETNDDDDEDIDMNDYRSKIEFVRKSGDSISFSRFWCDIKQIMLNGSRMDHMLQGIHTMKGMGFIENVTNKEVRNELDVFNEDLNENDEYMKDAMRVFINCKLGDVIKEEEVLKHDAIMDTLIEETLYDADIGIVRGALIILISIIERCNQFDIQRVLIQNNGYNLMKSIIHSLNGDSVLIQKYAVKLLSKLSAFSSFLVSKLSSEENNDGVMVKNELKSSYKGFESSWIDITQNNKYYAFGQRKDVLKQAMFKQINETLFK